MFKLVHTDLDDWTYLLYPAIRHSAFRALHYDAAVLNLEAPAVI